MKSFLQAKGLVRQHLDSYNDFIENGLQEIVDKIGEIQIESPQYSTKVKLGRIEVGRPCIIEVDGSEHSIYTTEARLRDLTYAAPMRLEITLVEDGVEKTKENVYIGDLPVMLKSKLCPLSSLSPEELINIGEDPYDPGGYFIINGSERVIVALEDLAPNRILVDVKKAGGKLSYQAKIFSTTIGFRARILLELKPNASIFVSIPGVPTSIPFVILMRALGLESDKEIAEAVSLDGDIQDQLEPSFEKATDINTTKDAIEYIGNRVAYGQLEEYRIRRAKQVLDRNFMPHIGQTNDKRREKALFLGEMALRVIELKLKRREIDDRDHYANKRIRLAGPLLADLFRMAFGRLFRDIKYQLDRMSVKGKKLSISASVRPGIITNLVKHAVATGNWRRGGVGITQLLDRTNIISTLSHLRRLQSPLSRSQPNFEARDLHPTHLGRICPNETPEGSNCGLVKNLSLMACISVEAKLDEIKYILYTQLGVVSTKDAIEALKEKSTKVFLNGILTGYSEKPESLVNALRKMRRIGEISSEVNVTFYTTGGDKGIPQEVYINCDAGRVRRPLIVVKNGKPSLTSEQIEELKSGDLKWEDLVKSGCTEYLDAEEEENAFIALDMKHLTRKHTHLEIASYAMLGVSASLIPYAEHNQSPRNSYEAAMAKQALGIYSTNFRYRVDSRSHILHYPQLPLVRTKPMEIIGLDNKPCGQNCVVAVISFHGYNMEDALVFNKSSIDRGLGISSFYRVYKSEGRQYLGGLKDRFEIPESGIRGYRGEQYYRLLEEDGIISVESYLSGNEVLVGRTSPPRFLEEFKEFEVREPTRRDTSIVVRPAEQGTVDSVFITATSQGNNLVKVKVRDRRVPELGDKFASRHGQKGVIGMVYPQEDLPFTEDGVVPDIIVNPHAFPSRMTVGQLIESIAGKVAALNGKFVDGTPFDGSAQKDLRNSLLDLGFQYSGREVMYNGVTGEKFDTDIFIGLVYYQKLHHMVADKMHARARGQVAMLTRQPTEGRARGGGLRFGEMERDCLVGHGAALLLKDRLLDESDKYIMYVCEKCGYLAYYDFKQRKYVCRICGDDAVISPVIVSYAFKLLQQELMSLCISPRLILKEKA